MVVESVAIIESLVELLIVSARTADNIVVRNLTAVGTPLGINSNAGSALLTLLCGNHDNTIGTT